MTLSSMLRLDQLALRNFRCFSECQIDLHPELTVLVAENGCGKTAVLDALRIALGPVVDTITQWRQWPGIQPADVRSSLGDDGNMKRHGPAKLAVSGVVNGEQIQWTGAINKASKWSRRTTNGTEALRNAVLKIRARAAERPLAEDEETPSLPVVCFYGTGRLLGHHYQARLRNVRVYDRKGRTGGYVDCLSSSSSFKIFENWFETTSSDMKIAASKAFGEDEKPARLITAVREATKIVLEPTGWRDLEWVFPTPDKDGMPKGRGYLAVRHPEHGRLPLTVLSDGVKNMIALVADLASRCVRLNSHLFENAVRCTPGVALIDEVDMHLHPSWQQTVIASLREAFPSIQFVVTTHSHLVTSTVAAESLRIIRRDGIVSQPTVETQGYDSLLALGVVFGVNSTPPIQIARHLTRYRSLLEEGQGDAEEARDLRGRLLDHFGATHPAMLEADGIRRLQEFKARIAANRARG